MIILHLSRIFRICTNSNCEKLKFRRTLIVSCPLTPAATEKQTKQKNSIKNI